MTAKSEKEATTILNPPRPGRWITGIVALLLVIGLVVIFAKGRIEWHEVPDYIFDTRVLVGMGYTVLYTVIAMIMGVVGGLILAVMKMSDIPVLRTISWAYVWFFRGTPVLVQLLLWFNIGLVLPQIAFGIPGMEPWVQFETNALVTPFLAAVLGLGLHEAAYMSEIVRAGLLSVHKGQREAAKSVGMTPAQCMFRVILPQATKIIIPPTGNQFIGMLKTTSLVVVIAGSEMMTVVQNIYARNFLTFELLIVACIWYLVLTTLSELGLRWLEKRFSNEVVLERKLDVQRMTLGKEE